MYNTTDTLQVIETNEYIRSYRDTTKFIVFCKQCKQYGNCWSCPPFSFDTDKYLSGYSTVLLIGTKITSPDKDTFIKERKKLDSLLLQMEARHPDSKAFFAGFCHGCGDQPCSRITGEPCRFPEKRRPSLEALGFDIGRTASELLGIELKWGSGGEAPEYLTLVSGFFTNHNPEEIVWKR